MYTRISAKRSVQADSRALQPVCAKPGLGTGAREDSRLSERISTILADSWATRVAVRTSHLDLKSYYDKSIPDFPPALVPFKADARYLALDVELQRCILAGGWVAYNEKTIGIEASIVAPACELLLKGAFDGIDTAAAKRAIVQTQVDEQFHILMCLDACLVARELHGIQALRIPKSLVVAELERELERCVRPRDAELIQLAFATVAELTINAYLELLANDVTIQALNRETTALHRKDESSHSKLFREFSKDIFPRFEKPEQAVYLKGLAAGLNAFVKVDLNAWSMILHDLGVPEAADMIRQCLVANASKRIVRDCSSLQRLLLEIDVKEEQIAFQFNGTA